MARRVNSDEAGPSTGYFYYTDNERAQLNQPNIFDSFSNEQNAERHFTSLRNAKSAPSCSTSDENEAIGLAERLTNNLDFWRTITTKLESQIMDSIQRAIQENDQTSMMLQKENLKRFHNYLKLKDEQVMVALTKGDEKWLENEIFEAFEDLQSNMYHPDERANTKLPVYKPTSYVATDYQQHQAQPRHGKIPIYQASKPALVHMKRPTPATRIAEQSRSVSQMTLADKLAMAKREELRKLKLSQKRDKLRIERENQIILPRQLTPAERERIRMKKHQFDKDYEEHLRTARAVGAVRKLMKEVEIATPTTSQTLLQAALKNVADSLPSPRNIEVHIGGLLSAARHSSNISDGVIKQVAEMEQALKEPSQQKKRIPPTQHRMPTNEQRTKATSSRTAQTVRPLDLGARRQPSEALLKQRERIRKMGVIPVPSRATSKISLNEVTQRNQRWDTKTAKTREMNRTKRLDKIILPTPLTEQEKEKVKLKTRKFEKDYQAVIASARAVFTVKKCMAELGVRESRPNIANIGSESDLVTSVMSDVSLAANINAAAVQKRLNNLLVVAKRGKSLKSDKIANVVLNEIKKLTSKLSTVPSIGQLTMPRVKVRRPSSNIKNEWLEFWSKIFNEVEKTNNALLKHYGDSGDQNNYSVCQQKINELQEMKKNHEKTINEALQTNDTSAIGQAIFASIQLLESGQFLCNDVLNPNCPNLTVEIKALPALKKKAITLLKRHREAIKASEVGAERRRKVEVNLNRDPLKRKLFSTPNLNPNVPQETLQTTRRTPFKTHSSRSAQRITSNQNLADASRKGIEAAKIASARRLQNLQNNSRSVPMSRSVSNLRSIGSRQSRSNSQIPSSVRPAVQSQSLVNASRKAIEDAKMAAKRRLQKFEQVPVRVPNRSTTNIRSVTSHPRMNVAAARRLQSAPRRIENMRNATPNMPREPASFISFPRSRSTGLQGPAALSDAALRRHEIAMQNSRRAAERRLSNFAQYDRQRSTVSAPRPRNELSHAERKAYEDRQRIQQEHIKNMQVTGERRRQAALQASSATNQFGSAARTTTLPPSNVAKSTKTRAELERAMRKITNEYQRFVAQKKGVGEVKKQLYNIPTYVEDRQRRGVHLPRNLVSTPIASRNVTPSRPVVPSDGISIARQRFEQEKAFSQNVKRAEHLLESAHKAKSRADIESVRQQMQNLGISKTPMPTKRSSTTQNQLIVNREEIISTIETVETHGRPTTRTPMTRKTPTIQTQRSSSILKNIQLAASKRIDTEQRRLNAKRKTIDKCNQIIQKKKEALKNAKIQIPGDTDQTILQRCHPINRSAIEELLIFWNKTTADLLKCNTTALRNGQQEISRNPNETTQLWYLECKEKQKNVTSKIADQQRRIYDAIDSGDLNQLDIVIYKALEKIFEDQFICGENPIVRKASRSKTSTPTTFSQRRHMFKRMAPATQRSSSSSHTSQPGPSQRNISRTRSNSRNRRSIPDKSIKKPGETGYHRQKLAELKREIVSDLKKNEEGHATPYAYSRVARECDVPDGWIHPTSEQIQQQLKKMRMNIDYQFSLPELLQYFPINKQHMRVPPNKPNSQPFSSYHQRWRDNQPTVHDSQVPNVVMDADLAEAIVWAWAEETDNSSVLSYRVRHMLENPAQKEMYIKGQKRLQQIDGKTFKNIMEKGRPKKRKQSPQDVQDISVEQIEVSASMRQVVTQSSKTDVIEAEDPADISRPMDNESRGISVNGSPKEIVPSILQSKETVVNVVGTDQSDPSSFVPSINPSKKILDIDTHQLSIIETSIQSVNQQVPSESLASETIHNVSSLDSSNITNATNHTVNIIQYAFQLNRPIFENFAQLKGTLRPLWFPGFYTASANGHVVGDESPPATLDNACKEMQTNLI